MVVILLEVGTHKDGCSTGTFNRMGAGKAIVKAGAVIAVYRDPDLKCCPDREPWKAIGAVGGGAFEGQLCERGTIGTVRANKVKNNIAKTAAFMSNIWRAKYFT